MPDGLSKATPFGFAEKIILAPSGLAVFFRKALHNPARDSWAGKKVKYWLHGAGDV
ncbi:hypothetical protein AAH068_20170 [Bacteroides uniformis]|uniref:hypothetical protein n=1 Tax=Bacteroides uniformis TaxID=820 RepID=UPI0039B5FD18